MTWQISGRVCPASGTLCFALLNLFSLIFFNKFQSQANRVPFTCTYLISENLNCREDTFVGKVRHLHMEGFAFIYKTRDYDLFNPAKVSSMLPGNFKNAVENFPPFSLKNWCEIIFQSLVRRQNRISCEFLPFWFCPQAWMPPLLPTILLLLYLLAPCSMMRAIWFPDPPIHRFMPQPKMLPGQYRYVLARYARVHVKGDWSKYFCFRLCLGQGFR